MYLISDLHFSHKNIIEYENRPFKDLDDMHKKIIKDWNTVIHKKDFVYILGDFSFGNQQMIKDVTSKLNGRLYLIMGNHDSKRSYKWWLENGFEWVSKYPIIYEDFYILSHKPIPNLSSGFYNIHGHLHSKQTADNNHFNVSLDNIGNKPIDFRKIKEKFVDGKTK
jgi:calcineurin-like phosphoesterase family protein